MLTINESESIKDEKSFRAAAEAKFKKVFGDDLDKDKMNQTIDGLLKDNKELVDILFAWLQEKYCRLLGNSTVLDF